MKKEELFHVLGDIDEELVRDAADYRAKRNVRFIRWAAVAATAVAAFALVFNVPGLFSMGKSAAPMAAVDEEAVQEMEDAYNGIEEPAPAAQPRAEGKDSNKSVETGTMGYSAERVTEDYGDMSAERFINSNSHWEWWSEYRTVLPQARQMQGVMKGYYLKIVPELLSSKEENSVCSPLNTYIAFTVLADLTEGESREQILTMLGANDMRTAKERFDVLWTANSVDTPRLKSVLSNSIWLRNDREYNDKLIKTLAKDYHLSSFVGEMGSKRMNEALVEWMDESTHGLLREYTKDMKFDRNTVIKLISAIYYKAAWTENFNKSATDRQTFHGQDRDTVVDMMHRTDSMSYYSNESFEAVSMGLFDSGAMHVFLPRSGTDVDALMRDARVYDIAAGEGNLEPSYPLVTLSIPKFSVNNKVDLIEILRKMGVTDILDEDKANFRPITFDNIFLSSAEHAAVVEIDEDGATGAAYTEMTMADGAPAGNKVRFTVDRPFMFIITGSDGSILFAGVIRNLDRQ